MFKSVEGVLNWAALIKSTEIIDEPSINKMRGRLYGTSNELLIGLSPQQIHMQAEEIFCCVIDMDDKAASEYILAKYFYQPKFEALMTRVMASLLYSGGVYRRGIQSLALEYIVNKKVTHRELRQQLHCGNDNVHKFRDQVYAALDKVHNRAIGELETKFIDARLIAGYDNVACL